LQSWPETSLGEDRRVDPPRDLLQILDCRYQSRRDLGQLGAGPLLTTIRGTKK
jgi:hypothetical protein